MSLKGDDDVLSIGLNRAVTLLAEAAEKGGGQGLLRELGNHPTTGEPVTLNRGRFGPYVKHGKIMASLRKANDPETMTLDDAMVLIQAKEERDAAKGKGKAASAKKAPAKKTADSGEASTRKAPAKKAAPKKAAKKPAAKKPATKKPPAKKTMPAKADEA